MLPYKFSLSFSKQKQHPVDMFAISNMLAISSRSTLKGYE